MKPPVLIIAVINYCFLAVLPANNHLLHQKKISGAKQPEAVCYNISNHNASCKLYLLYPRNKEDKSFYVFINKKYVSRINYGERLEFEFATGIDVVTVIQETEEYAEPRTASKNMRNLFLKDDKNYYLQINGKGQLAYIPDENEGEKLLNDNGKYVAALKQVTE